MTEKFRSYREGRGRVFANWFAVEYFIDNLVLIFKKNLHNVSTTLLYRALFLINLLYTRFATQVIYVTGLHVTWKEFLLELRVKLINTQFFFTWVLNMYL